MRPLMPMLKFCHCGKVRNAHHAPHISCVKNGLYERITKFDAQKSFPQPQNACRNRKTQLYMNAPSESSQGFTCFMNERTN